jgi:hypothetical protein
VRLAKTLSTRPQARKRQLALFVVLGSTAAPPQLAVHRVMLENTSLTPQLELNPLPVAFAGAESTQQLLLILAPLVALESFSLTTEL